MRSLISLSLCSLLIGCGADSMSDEVTGDFADPDAHPGDPDEVDAGLTDAPPPFEGTGGVREVPDFGDNPGFLKMYEYVPAGMPPGAPLVVVMHGCGQTAAAADDEPGWLELADRYSFAIAFPEADGLMKCYNVEKVEDHTRGQGDVASIRSMVAWMESSYQLDPARTFATGFSSGGEMTDVLLGAYPDVFEAGAAQAGIPYKCATDSMSLGTCTAMGGRDLTPAEWAALVREANPGDWTWPRMLVLHGTEDNIVSSANLVEEMEQWTELNGIDQVPDVEDEIGGFPHRVYTDSLGNSRVETISFTGMGHKNPVNPGEGDGTCGKVTLEAFTEDVGVCVAEQSLRFFGIAP